MYSKADLQYPEHARANEPVKGRKIRNDKTAFHNVGPFMSASLAGAVMFTYISSHKLNTSAENLPLKPVAAAIVQPSFEPFPEKVSEPATKEEKDLKSLPSPEPAPIKEPIRVTVPTPEPTPDPIQEDLYEFVIEPTPKSSDPEPDPTPTPVPQTAPEIRTDSVINILIDRTNGDLVTDNTRKFSVTLNKIADGNATVKLFVKKEEFYDEDNPADVAVYNKDGQIDGTVEDGVWSGEVKYNPNQSVTYNSYPAKIVMDYEYSDGTTGSEELDEFKVYELNTTVNYSQVDKSLEFCYPIDLFGNTEDPEDAIESTSLQCEAPDGSSINSTGPEISFDDCVYVRYSELEDNPVQINYDAEMTIEAVSNDGSTTEIQITNKGTVGG